MVKHSNPVKKIGSRANSTNVSLLGLFRFSTWLDAIHICVGAILAALAGSVIPVLFIMFGNMSNAIINYAHFQQTSDALNSTANEIAKEVLMTQIGSFTLDLCLLGCTCFICTYASTFLICQAAIRQVSTIRSSYMKSMLYKDISWYDTNKTGDFSSRMIGDLGKIEEVLGDKLAAIIYCMGLICASIILPFCIGWELSLICLAYFPVSLCIGLIVTSFGKKIATLETDACARTGAIAEEVFSAIRTVIAFDGQPRELARYKKFTKMASKYNIKREFFNALNSGSLWLLVFCSFALSFWYGIKLVLQDREKPKEERIYTPGSVYTIFHCIMSATYNYGMCSKLIEMFVNACAAASKIFQVIDEVPCINLSKGAGFISEFFNGSIEFRNIHFHYPSRKEANIFNDFNLEIKKGETVALVGNSGCGKSTCIQLIQRFYDPVTGDVLIDGRNLKDYDLNWLRSKIGVVGQEPVLFATTIEENIRFGNVDATFKDIEDAAKSANAHNFISKLPNGYNTVIGERGAQLSGGQKQRIAIARALIRNPQILLLDEATSALDSESEALVQNALHNASKQQTTVIVAHRLSTIRGADRIVVINEGLVVEEGSHDVLMKRRGDYYKLVTAQTTTSEDESETEDGGNPETKMVADEIEKSQKEETLKIDVDNFDIDQKSDALAVSSLTVIGKILMLNKREWWAIIIGSLGAVAHGASMPGYCFVLADILQILTSPDDNYVRSEGNAYCLYFVIIAVIAFSAMFLQSFLFAISGQNLTNRIRLQLFETMLRQEMAWYDRPENGVGALCAKLSGEAAAIQGASGQSIGTILNSLSSLAIAFAIVYFYDWRIALVGTIFVPILFLSIYFEKTLAGLNTLGDERAIENSSKFAVEIIDSIRTVASLGIEDCFHERYLNFLEPCYAQWKRSAHVRGMVVGLSRAMQPFCRCATIYYGVTLLKNLEIRDISIIYKVAEILTVGTWAIGNAVAFTPNIQKGLTSAKNFCQLMSREPAIQDDESSTITQIPAESDVHYKDVTFSYPNRPNVSVLNGLNLDVMHEKTVALVGPSGCGKSTIVQLLERFYDPLEGQLSLNDQNIKNVKLSSLRLHLGIVSQEPNLFDCTILENIAYGDTSRVVTEEECIQAAKKANSHNFITALPLGYETRLGEKGTQLSGGQKQRVAIARALIRNPKILLLDEATSALDAESEKIVQEALNKAREGRTCLTIAHRLSTIQDADLIVVIDKGAVAEMGTHQKLLEEKEIYYKLNNMHRRRRSNKTVVQ